VRRGRVVAAVMLGLIGVSLVLPAVASGILGGRLAPLLAAEFDVPEQDVTLDLALSPVWDLVRGRIGDVGIQVAGYEVATEDGIVLIDPLGVALLNVRIALGDAIGGSLEQVDFAEGLVFARLPFDALEPLVAPRLARQGLVLSGLAGDGTGALLIHASIRNVAGSDFTVRAMLEVVDEGLLLADALVIDGELAAQALIDRADLSVSVPDLPAGIVLTEAAADEQSVRVRGVVAGPLLLTAVTG